MSKHSTILEKYLDNIIKKNSIDEYNDIRLKFFYEKKLNKILMLQRSTSCQIHPFQPEYSPELIQSISSCTRLHEINIPFEICAEDFKTSQSLRNLVVNNLDVLTYNEASIAKLDACTTIGDGEKDNQIFLERIHINKELRGKGLSHKLINYLKSSAVNNGRKSILGTIVPLDPEGFRDYCDRYKVSHSIIIPQLDPTQKFTSIEDLFEIYAKLGFNVDKEVRKIKMDINSNNSIPEEDKLCRSFTSYSKDDETIIMF
jgi:hypothetical protein